MPEKVTITAESSQLAEITRDFTKAMDNFERAAREEVDRLEDSLSDFAVKGRDELSVKIHSSLKDRFDKISNCLDELDDEKQKLDAKVSEYDALMAKLWDSL